MMDVLSLKLGVKYCHGWTVQGAKTTKNRKKILGLRNWNDRKVIQLPSTVIHACAYTGQVQLTVVWASIESGSQWGWGHGAKYRSH